MVCCLENFGREKLINIVSKTFLMAVIKHRYDGYANYKTVANFKLEYGDIFSLNEH